MTELTSQDARTFLIVGASLAGAKAAETLRAEGFAGRVILVGEEPELPYERPPLSKGRWSTGAHPITDGERAELERRRDAVRRSLAGEPWEHPQPLSSPRAIIKLSGLITNSSREARAAPQAPRLSQGTGCQ